MMPIDTLNRLQRSNQEFVVNNQEDVKQRSHERIGLPRIGFTILSIILVDLFSLSISIGITVAIRLNLGGGFAIADYARLWPTLGVFLITFAFWGLYPGVPLHPAKELPKVFGAVAIVFMIMGVVIFLTHSEAIWSRSLFLLACPLSAVMVVLGRNAVRHRLGPKQWWGLPAVVIGTGKAAQAAIDVIEGMPWLGLKAVALVDTNESGSHRTSVDLAQDPESSREKVHYAIASIGDGNIAEISKIVDRYGSGYKHMLFLQDEFYAPSLCLTCHDIGGLLGLEVNQNLLQRFPTTTKRILDIAITSIAFVLLLPLFIFISLAIKMTSEGPIIYGQRRIGRGNKYFTLWKFRTMVSDADSALDKYLVRKPLLKEEWMRCHKIHNDPRITKIGRLLRRTSLDELPQLWNVLRGEMSLVGPRPIVDHEVLKYGPSFARYCKVRPGMSGLWQVSGRSKVDYGRRVKLDEYYVRNWSIWLDVYILARTLRAIWCGDGAY
jgi:Undecaprenyl-phosphate galactose phosphotransferase WbaP